MKLKKTFSTTTYYRRKKVF